MDNKGRLIVPAAFREVLNLRENSNVLLSLDTSKNELVILPFAAAGDELYRVESALSDAPGSLSRLLSILAKHGIDLVQSESIASDRGRSAEWRATVDLSKCRLKPTAIKELLLKEKVASAVEMARI
jgi:bifunctional DNA-binding transcriptional regulator/antitoxin component of YhaV-PrlF toxin-antitoxin module